MTQADDIAEGSCQSDVDISDEVQEVILDSERPDLDYHQKRNRRSFKSCKSTKTFSRGDPKT